MFYVYSPNGHVFSGTLEQLRKTQALSRVSQTREVDAVANGQDEGAPTQVQSHESHVAKHVVHAYSTATRQPLTIVGDVMRRPPHVIPFKASVRDAWQILRDRNIGQAPVVNTAGVLVGLVTRAELLPPQWLASAVDAPPVWQTMLANPVSEVMWTPVPSTYVDTDLRRVASLLLETGLPGLPVTDSEGKVIGFVSRSDLLKAMISDPPLEIWS